MRKSKETPERVRITFDVPKEFYDRLEKLERCVQADSKSHVIREALRLYEYVVNQYLEGNKFFARTKDGKEESIFFLGSSPPPA